MSDRFISGGAAIGEVPLVTILSSDGPQPAAGICRVAGAMAVFSVVGGMPVYDVVGESELTHICPP